MEKLRALLVSTDLSPRANHALARAAMLAREHGAGLTVQHVVAVIVAGLVVMPARPSCAIRRNGASAPSSNRASVMP